MSPFEIAVVAIAAVPSYLLVAVLLGRFLDWVWEVGDHKNIGSNREVIIGLLWPTFLPLVLVAIVMSVLFVAVEWGMGRPSPDEEQERAERREEET